MILDSKVILVYEIRLSRFLSMVSVEVPNGAWTPYYGAFAATMLANTSIMANTKYVGFQCLISIALLSERQVS